MLIRIMAEREQIEGFWDHYADAGQGMRQACSELLFELNWTVEALKQFLILSSLPGET